MAFFGTPNAFLGIDIGTSSLKLVELVDRRKRVEVATYAQADMTNPLLDERLPDDVVVSQVANIITRMMESAGVSTDIAIAALPSAIVFSTVLSMPNLPDAEMDKAVRFSARDVVPSDLEDMVLGWSKIAQEPHMETDEPHGQNQATTAEAVEPEDTLTQVPVFLTAAPKQIVNRYMKVLEAAHLKLHALEVETFPLVRSLLSSKFDSALIIDIGDLATTFHIVDQGTPRVSHTIEYGGYHITAKIAQATQVAHEEAAKEKVTYGLDADAPANIRAAVEEAVTVQVQKAISLLRVYQSQQHRPLIRSVLIGGGANLRSLAPFWSRATGHTTTVGNPWKGLSYPQELESKLTTLGPTYGVAVGLALRGLKQNV